MSRLGVLLAFAAALHSPGIIAQSSPPASDSNACPTSVTLDELTKDSKPSQHGMNSIQAVDDGSRWRVLAVSWEMEATAGAATVDKP